MMKHTHSHEYKALLNSIPGGVQQCLNNASFTMEEINQGFLDLFGFTEEELAERFHSQFAEMVHPDDLQSLQDEVSATLGCGQKASLQYRVLCKDGSYKWVMDNAQLIRDENGEERIFCILIDITESRRAREELRLSLERHQIIMDQATDIIFVWDFQSDAMTYSPNWEKKFGYVPRYDGLNQKKTVFRNIHPDDIPTLRAAMIAIRGGEAFATAEARVKNAEQKFIWCRFRATCQYDEAGKPLKAVGVITDIDNEKKKLEDLQKRAERDALTGLYNRKETERLICKQLEDHPEEICALLMIDTDDFKGVNDRQGHLFGDAVLSELAAGMKKMTRQSDIVGRIGGDEFAILLKDIPSKETAVEKARQLLDLFQQLFQQGKQPIQVTCSAGIALYPEDGKDFKTLYRGADQALYQAKSQGKNQYVLYDRTNAVLVEQMGYSALGAIIDSDQQTPGAPGDLLSYVLQVLYDNQDIDRVIHLILEIVGKQFDVSRAYVFENTEDGKYCDNTYEWCNSGITPQKEFLQHFPYEQVKGYDNLFKDGSIFYCRDIHALTPEQSALFESQGICSTLQCAIRDQDTFRGFIGFDECTGIRMWTKEEIGILSLISQLLTVFLLKKQATDRDQQLAIQLNTILDTQDAYIYVVEDGSFELLYLNRKTRELDPSAAAGMTCYEAFFGRKSPCDTCPLFGGAGEIYNPKYNVWSRVRASSMKWGTIDAHLLTCFDITEYKRLLELGSTWRLQNGKDRQA